MSDCSILLIFNVIVFASQQNAHIFVQRQIIEVDFSWRIGYNEDKKSTYNSEAQKESVCVRQGKNEKKRRFVWQNIE